MIDKEFYLQKILSIFPKNIETTIGYENLSVQFKNLQTKVELKDSTIMMNLFKSP